MHAFLTSSPAIVLAQEGAPAAPGGGSSSLLLTFLPIILVFAIFYFLVIRPDKKRRAERQAMVDALQKNDHVVTIGGIHGVVKSLSADEVVIQVDDSNNTRIRFTRNAVSEVMRKDAPEE
jgi:preprotein translocase subunit YajC